MLPCIAGKSGDKKGSEQEWQKKIDGLAMPVGLPNLIMLTGALLVAAFMRSLTSADTQEISFQHFKTQLLAKDVVDRIEVANKTTAKVSMPDMLSCMALHQHAYLLGLLLYAAASCLCQDVASYHH